jgi:hypothetical protein
MQDTIEACSFFETGTNDSKMNESNRQDVGIASCQGGNRLWAYKGRMLLPSWERLLALIVAQAFASPNDVVCGGMINNRIVNDIDVFVLSHVP